MLVWLWACVDPPDEVPPAGPDLIPPIDEALAEICPQPWPTQPDSGEALHRVTLHDSPARCNDGTPPVMYIRRALDPEREHEWLVHLDGGAACFDHQSCMDRWCHAGVYNASDMSSRWAPESIRTDGLLASSRDNSFGGLHVAQVYYCSSDYWLGTEPAKVLEGDPPYLLHFEGDGIIDAAFAALREGVTSDDGEQTLPPLEQASSLLFAGSSAGGFGVALQLNQIARSLPEVQVMGVIDSAITPTLETLEPQDAAALEATLRATWESPGQALWGAVADVACAEVTPEAELWRCFDTDQVLRNHVHLPITYHHDLYDPVIGDFFQMAGLQREPFIEATIETLRGYASRPDTSVHASACGVHMSLVRDEDFLEMGVVDAQAHGLAWTMHDVLRVAASGGQISAIDDETAEGSRCP
jgi:hypothetical protein